MYIFFNCSFIDDVYFAASCFVSKQDVDFGYIYVTQNTPLLK
jgi:hypothetical protein